MKRLLPLTVLLGGCFGPQLDGDGVFVLESVRRDRAHLRYADGQISVNDACMIRLENGLNPRIPPMYVNGRPLGFC